MINDLKHWKVLTPSTFKHTSFEDMSFFFDFLMGTFIIQGANIIVDYA
jgi:hypothetical protein